MKISELPDNRIVEIYIELRDRRAARKAAFTNDDIADKGRMDKLENLLMVRFNEQGHDSINTPAGTAYKSVKTSATVADGAAFFNFCRDTDQWGLLERSANKAAVIAYREEHDDIPPGINWKEFTTITVRRA